MHSGDHPLKGVTVQIKFIAPHPQLEGLEHEFELENWWDTLTGKSWMFSDGNPAALIYAMRLGFNANNPETAVPVDNEVVYGKIGSFGHLIHQSELVIPETAEEEVAA